MVNEELAAVIRDGDDTRTAELWEQLQGFTNQQTYKFYITHQNNCNSAGVTPDDLIQEAFLALVTTVQGYDPSHHLLRRCDEIPLSAARRSGESKAAESLSKP